MLNAPTNVKLTGSVLSWVNDPAATGVNLFIDSPTTHNAYSKYQAGIPTFIDFAKPLDTTAWGSMATFPLSTGTHIITVANYDNTGTGPQSSPVTLTLPIGTTMPGQPEYILYDNHTWGPVPPGLIPGPPPVTPPPGPPSTGGGTPPPPPVPPPVPPPPPQTTETSLIDTFARTAASGTFGTPSDTPTTPYSLIKGPASNISLTGTAGKWVIQSAPFKTAETVLMTQAQCLTGTGTFQINYDTNVKSLAQSSGGLLAGIVLRYQPNITFDDSKSHYRMSLSIDSSTNTLHLRAQDGSGLVSGAFRADVDTGIDPTVDFPGGTPYQYNVRIAITNHTPTQFQMKVWKVGNAEPTNYQLTATDSSDFGPQTAGEIGVRASFDSNIGGTYYNGTGAIEITNINFVGMLPTQPPPPPATVAPGVPSLQPAVVSGDNVALQWSNVPAGSPSPGATTENRIYRGGTIIATTTVPTTTFTDTVAAGTYSYQVTAVNQAGESAKSNTDTVTVTSPPITGSGHPLVGLFVGSQTDSGCSNIASQLGVNVTVRTVYDSTGYGSWFDPNPSGRRLMVGIGNISSSAATTYGNQLVSNGHANAIIRLMWELNGDWYPWGIQNLSAAQQISEYIRVRAALKSAAGNSFTFSFCVAFGTVRPHRTRYDAFPGSQYVDYLGADAYDSSTVQTEMQTHVNFAKANGVAVGVEEWGPNGTDNPNYINWMSSFVHNPANNVHHQALFNFASNSIDSCLVGCGANKPNARAAYTADFKND